jgi:hypothetical protein
MCPVMDQKLLGENLFQPSYARRHPVRFVGILAATAAVLVGAWFGGTAVAESSAPHTAKAVEWIGASTEGLNRAPVVTDEQEQQAAAQVAELAQQQAAAAQAAAAAAAAQAAEPKQNSGSHAPTEGLPAGSRVPSIPGTDSPDTTACASGSASTVDGVPVCD